MKLGRYEKALDCFNKSFELNTRHYVIWNNKALALYKLERFDEALDCVNKALKLDENKKIWVNKARILMKIGEKEEALECIDNVLMLDPNFGKAVEVKKELLKDH